MFDVNYDQNYGSVVKKWAKAIYIAGIVLIPLFALVGLVLLFLDMLLIGLVIAVAGAISGVCVMLSGHLLWGFAELVEKTQKIARTNHSNLILDHLKTSK